MMVRQKCLIRTITLLAIVSATAYGQWGRITGRITDSTSAVVVDADVRVMNQDTGIKWETKSNEVGYYTLSVLPPGRYQFLVQKSGFRPISRSGVALEVGQVARVDFVLDVGTLAETITVQGDASHVQTEQATLGTVVERRRIAELPLNGRNVFALVMLVAGVKSQAGPMNSGFSDRGISLSAVAINGGPSALNSYVLDGGNNNQSYLADLNVNPAVDAIEEFKVQTNNMSAEYGFTAGGVVNLVTRSGTNDAHGSLYEFLRNDKLDARNTFSTSKNALRYNQFGGALGGPVYLPRLYQGRDRTFFFFNYEEWRFRQFLNPITSVPTASQRKGDFSDLRDANGLLTTLYDPSTTRANSAGAGYLRDPLPGNVLPSSALDPVAVNMLQFYPLPNRTPSNVYTNSNNYIATNAWTRSMRQYTAKIDHSFSAKNRLSGRFMYYRHFDDNGNSTSLSDLNTRLRLDNYETRNLVVTDTYTVSPTFLNEARVSIARHHFGWNGYSYGKNWPQTLGLPADFPSYTLPLVSNGLPSFSYGVSVGTRAGYTGQLVEMATLVRGGHTLKLGTEWRVQQANNLLQTQLSGSFSFPATLTGNPQQTAGTGSSFATFLLGAVGSATAYTYLGESEQGSSMSYFVQDDWKLRRRLTVNMGLRYDYQTWPVERNNGLSNFDPYQTNPDNGLAGRMEYAGIDYGRTALKSVRNNWSPRVGFAYDLTGRARTVLRGGYGIFYPTIFYRDCFGSTTGFANTPTQYQPANNNSNYAAFRFRDGLPSKPIQPIGAKLGSSAYLGSSVTWDQSSEKVPMSQQWSLSLQHQHGGWLIDAAYSANHVTHMISGSYDLNQLDPQYWALGLSLQNQVSNPYAGRSSGSLNGATISRSQSLLPYPYYSSISVRNPHLGNSSYNAFLLTVERRLTGGLTALVSYTNSKLISDSITTPENFGGAVEQVTVTGYQNGKFNRRAERSLDPTDVSQRLVFSVLYQFPFGRGKRWNPSNRFVSGWVSGWQVNTVSTIQSGLPVALTGASNFLASRPNSTGRSAKLDDRTAQRWFDTTVFVNPPNYTMGNIGRVLPDVRNPGAVNFDVSVVKETRLRERINLQFRAEAFNIANHVNLGLVNAGFSPGSDGYNRSATFGTITSARDPRILQFGLKLVF